MLALCFECGSKKTGALKLCKQCHAIPKSPDEKVLSLCLSLECVTQQTLNNCRKYFKKKNKPPRFKEPIVKRATEFLEEQTDATGTNQSIEFSSSVFNFNDLSEQDSVEMRRTVLVHVIGKGPKQDSADAHAGFGKAHKTYHQVKWEIGREVSEEQYESNKDPSGDLYVWYRWLNNRWTWLCVSSAKFKQLKAVESGRLG